jgi:hypothetical protein
VSAYVNDPRVVLRGDGTAIVPAMPGFEHEGDWEVYSVANGCAVRNTADQGYVTDEGDRYNQRPKVFATCDDAIAAIIGEPQ